MPRSGQYPCDHGRFEILQIESKEFGHCAFKVGKGDYSVTVYADGSYGIVMPESKRLEVSLQTGSDSLCILADSYCAIRI
jgi:hypothetical protein